MGLCVQCGGEIQVGWVACPKCGAPVPEVETGAQISELDLEKTRQRQVSSGYLTRPDHLAEGFVIDDRYVVERKLGQGGFGAVYLVHDRKLAVHKALKVIPEAVINDPEALDQLRREAQVMISLNHPNIVRVYDFHDDGVLKYIDMEYIPGRTLTEEKLKQEDRRIPEEQVLDYAGKIASALSYAHERNILHRDLKPQNVMVTESGEVKVMDFGIAETVRSSMSRIAQSNSSGTLVYMSPEQLRGKEVGKESDIYSFGALLYDLLSGHPPFFRGQIEYQILNEEPDKIPYVSTFANTLISRCLIKKYRDRVQSFGSILGALESGEFTDSIVVPRPVTQVLILPKILTGMVLVTNGQYSMGSDDYFEEGPVHTVKVSSFCMDKTPVTQAEYKRVMGNNPSHFIECEDFPVENVSWFDAIKYCNLRSEEEGLRPAYQINEKIISWEKNANGYRLPTEAEWEYAARNGSLNRKRKFIYSGSNKLTKVGWYKKNTKRMPRPVGEKEPNKLGLYDMSGNVWEWCWDWYDGNYYSYSPSDNPIGPSVGSTRVLRGGSWNSSDSHCRVANRIGCNPEDRSKSDGFRCVRGL